MVVTFEITSQYFGIIRRIFQRESNYVHEKEVLCLLQTHDGKEVEVCSNFSGTLVSLNIEEGRKVAPHTVLAELEEEFDDITMSSD